MGDAEYTREWIKRAGGTPWCNKCKLHFGGDYSVSKGYFDRPCENFNIDMPDSEKMKVPLSERIPCGGTWGVWPLEDPLLKYICTQDGAKTKMRVFSFDENGTLFRKIETPIGFSIEKYCTAQLGCFDQKFVCREPLTVLNLISRNDGAIWLTFVCFNI